MMLPRRKDLEILQKYDGRDDGRDMGGIKGEMKF